MLLMTLVTLLTLTPAHADGSWLPGATVVRCVEDAWTPLELRDPDLNFQKFNLGAAFPKTKNEIYERIDQNMITFALQLQELEKNTTIVNENFDTGKPQHLELPAPCEAMWATRVMPGSRTSAPRIFENRDLLRQIPTQYHAWIRIRSLAALLLNYNEVGATVVMRSLLLGKVDLKSEDDWIQAVKFSQLYTTEWFGLPIRFDYEYGMNWIFNDPSEHAHYIRIFGMTLALQDRYAPFKIPAVSGLSRDYPYDQATFHFTGTVREAGDQLPMFRDTFQILKAPSKILVRHDGIESKTFFPVHFKKPLQGYKDWQVKTFYWNKSWQIERATALFQKDLNFNFIKPLPIKIDAPREESILEQEPNFLKIERAEAYHAGKTTISNPGSISVSYFEHEKNGVRFNINHRSENDPMHGDLSSFLSDQSFINTDCETIHEAQGVHHPDGMTHLDRIVCNGSVKIKSNFIQSYTGDWTYWNGSNDSAALTLKTPAPIISLTGFDWPSVFQLKTTALTVEKIFSNGDASGFMRPTELTLWGCVFDLKSNTFSNKDWSLGINDKNQKFMRYQFVVNNKNPSNPFIQTNIPSVGAVGIRLHSFESIVSSHQDNALYLQADIDRKISIRCEGSGKRVTLDPEKETYPIWFRYTATKGLRLQDHVNYTRCSD